jgi:copper chaperone CopZ
VKRVIVSLENQEAVVTYDPREATVEALIAAVGQAEGAAPLSAVVKGSAP